MEKIKYMLIGIGAGLAAFLLYSIPTAIIKNPIFKRMTPVTLLDYILLTITSLLLGIYVAMYLLIKNKKKNESFGKKGEQAAAAGAFLGIFAFACPICNALFVSIFGVTALLMYYEPYRPLVGIITVGLISLGIFFQTKNLKCRACIGEN